ncbi:MAG: sugar phosphate isomerase/epimerase [Clostridia bacterium]|nr:sugar phosphate isomerase/epimerase [Clostridia bacterium]
MKLATTTGDFARWPERAFEQVKRVYNAGFRYVDLSLYDSYRCEEFMTDNWKKHAKELRLKVEDLGAKFVQAHSVGFNPISERDESWQKAYKETVRSIELCEVLGINNTVVHSGFQKGIGKEEFFEKNAEFYKTLLPVCEKTGVSVLIENSTKANIVDAYFFLHGKDMTEFLDYAERPLLNAVWDTGHANIEGSQYNDITALGKYLKAVHISDNNGKLDEHISPYFGTLDTDEVMHALIDAGFNGYFTFECEMSMKSVNGFPIGRNVYCKDNRTKDVPFFLQELMEKNLYETGKYILSQYGLFEE